MIRGLRWAVLVLATLVAVGVFVQVYLIAAYIFGAGGTALDAHETVGGVVHGLEVLVFLLAIGAFWRRWADVVLAFALAAIGTGQISFAEGERWLGAVHGVVALVVLVLASIIAHRTMRALGLGRHRQPGHA